MGLDSIDYDGCSELWMKNTDSWDKFSKDPEFLGKLMGDADHFMQLPFRCMLGYENIIFGPALPFGGAGGVTLEQRNAEHD